jgi:hypothetical protein
LYQIQQHFSALSNDGKMQRGHTDRANCQKKTYETGPKYSVIGTSNLEFEGTRPNKCLRTAKTRLMQAGRQQQPADDAIPGKKMLILQLRFQFPS